jgi:uncharacterized damage-inducible protein DinB
MLGKVYRVDWGGNMAKSNLIETWNIHNRINLYLLDALQEEHLNDLLSSKGRNVAEQFAHMHNVRLMWIKVAAPDLMSKLTKLEKEKLSKSLLGKSLTASAQGIEELLAKADENGGKVKNFKPHAAAFLGYMISHESHHRGQIVLALKQSGHSVDKKIAYGLWEWGAR